MSGRDSARSASVPLQYAELLLDLQCAPSPKLTPAHYIFSGRRQSLDVRPQTAASPSNTIPS